LEKIKVVYTTEQIQEKVRELADLISEDFGDEEIILICNLKGAFVFLADLCRYIRSPLCIDFIATTSYKGTMSTGDVRIIKDLKMDVRGKNLLLVEDIVDTGYTIDYILKYLSLHTPKTIRVCTLLDKKCKREVEIPIHYRGFEVSDRFVVGYGLDYNEQYRELDFIGELENG
jgi:hypoxanthine phosphoribosyltransferase